MTGKLVRRPAVSGSFYEADPSRLRSQVQWCFEHPYGPGRRPGPPGRRALRALIVPHAALQFSGPVAAHAYLRLAEARPPAVIVIVGPDHFARGAPIAIAPQSRWATPLGEVDTDHPVKAALLQRGLPADGRGHLEEHCVEVQLPFLQFVGYAGPVIPIVMADQETDTVERLADVLADTLEDAEATMIASTDLSHYLSHEHAVEVDRIVLDVLTLGDGRRLLDDVRRHAITMCGVGPAASVLEAARRLGCGPVELLSYATSGEISGDRRAVVGYAAAVLETAESTGRPDGTEVPCASC